MSATIVVAQALNEVLRAPQSLAWDDLAEMLGLTGGRVVAS